MSQWLLRELVPHACIFFSVLLLISAPRLNSAEPEARQKLVATNWSSFVEPEFLFFSAVLDARNLGPHWPTNNLTPRGLILNLGNHCWACFDTEMLRVSAIWKGEGITSAGLAQGSYQQPGRKAAEGQEKLPRVVGEPWITTGLYPGWQIGDQPNLSDPREPGPDPREVGRGPLSEAQGRLKALQLGNVVDKTLKSQKPGVCLEYGVYGNRVQEWIQAHPTDDSARWAVERHFRVAKVSQPLWLLLGHAASDCKISLIADNSAKNAFLDDKGADGCAKVRIVSSSSPVEFSVVVSKNAGAQSRSTVGFTWKAHPARRWPQRVTTEINYSSATNAFVVDHIPLPLDNPWRRNVRLADIAFFRDGRAAAVTFDGDVWLVNGLANRSGKVTWQRFASGFHEPLSLCIRENDVFVFDRNGIWKTMDTDGNGEADRYELFSNAFTQTAETREFANGMKLAPDGSFIIAKGGQESSTLGKLNGTVLRVSPDGKTFSVLGWGLRQPFIGVHPTTRLITASDQQGHYVPATPLHIIRDHQYYGFLAPFQPKEQYPAPIADPLVWIPHPVNASGAGQVWLAGARMGPLNDALIHIGYSRSEIFLVRLNSRGNRLQAAVASVAQNLDFAPLNGAVNPADGQLYVTGFQIWGSTARRVSGLARLRYTGQPSSLPREIAAMNKGILLRFDVALDSQKARDPANFSVERWNYKRTANYGSPHFRLDGTPGQEWLTPSSAYISRDRKSVFVGIPDMKPVMQMRISWALATEAGASFEQNAYLTPYELTPFDSERDGFGQVIVDLTPRTRRIVSTPVTVEEGRKLANLMGCAACHSVDGTTTGKVGPTWKGLFGSQREFKDGEPAIADEAYLRESILDPTAKVVQGFEKSDAGMPSYAGVLTEPQIEALILYIKTLK